MITHVAIVWKGTTYSLPRPKRHHDVIGLIHEQTGDTGIFGEQGFLDESGKFLDRDEGMRVAVATKQITTGRWPPRLFSEDLW